MSVTLPEEPGSAFEKEYQIALAARPDRLSSIPRPHVVEGETSPANCPLTLPTSQMLVIEK